MMQGKPSPLLSSFRLSYYTMLNMLRRLEGGDSSMEYVIKHSFQQFQQERQMPEVCAQTEGERKPFVFVKKKVSAVFAS